LRLFLVERGTSPVIPNNPTRKHRYPFDPKAYKLRNLIERMFCRLKDWRRVAPDTISSQPTSPPP
jgi:putative transposase